MSHRGHLLALTAFLGVGTTLGAQAEQADDSVLTTGESSVVLYISAVPNIADPKPRVQTASLRQDVQQPVEPTADDAPEELPPGNPVRVWGNDPPMPPHPDLPAHYPPHEPPCLPCDGLPKYGPLCKGGKGSGGGGTPAFVGYGDFLYWKTYPSDPQYTAVRGSGVATLPNPIIQGENLGMEFDSGPGVRFGGAWQQTCGWEVGLQLTCFDDEAWSNFDDNNLDAPPGIVPTMTHPFVVRVAGLRGAMNPATPDNPLGLAELVIPVQTATGHSNVEHRVFDLEIGKHLPVHPAVLVRTFGGFRFARNEQHSTFVYQTDPGDAADAGIDSFIIEDTVTHVSEMDAYGLRGGCDVYWDICRSGFSFYGNSSAALLLGDFQIARRETAVWENTDIPGSLDLEKNDNFKQLVPVFELGAGLRYNGQRFFGSVGYEFQYWMNSYNQLRPSSDLVLASFDLDRGGLGFGGLRLTVGATW